MVDDFMMKINGNIYHLKRNETALSGSLKDDSREDIRDSYMSNFKQAKSRKSGLSSKSDMSEDMGDHQSFKTGGTAKTKEAYEAMSDAKSYNRMGSMHHNHLDDQLSNNDLHQSRAKRSDTIGRKKGRFGHEQFSALQLQRLTKRDLVPPNKHHKLRSLDDFLNSKFDHYAKEYGEFFQKEITRFEEKLESLKREI